MGDTWSHQEGYPTRLRVHLPFFLAFTENDTILSNYTLEGNTDVTSPNITMTKHVEDPSGVALDVFDLVFSSGITVRRIY